MQLLKMMLANTDSHYCNITFLIWFILFFLTYQNFPIFGSCLDCFSLPKLQLMPKGMPVVALLLKTILYLSFKKAVSLII